MQMPITTFTLGCAPSSSLAIEGFLFDIEAAATDKLGFSVAGFSEVRNKELGVRVRSALDVAGLSVTGAKIAVRHRGLEGYSVSPTTAMCPALDLPIAVGLMLGGRFPRDLAIAGELGLDGSVRPIRGVTAFVEAARKAGLRGVVVPLHNANEALDAAENQLDVFAVSQLSQLAEVGTEQLDGLLVTARPERLRGDRHEATTIPDFRDVRGHGPAIAQLATAVAEGKDIVLVGPPGTGKTLLARRIPSIMRPLSRAQSARVTKIYSSLGLTESTITQRPVRAPHHTISAHALLGADGIDAGVVTMGSQIGRPGEIHLASYGVLVLDEVHEFSMAALYGIRHVLERMGASRPIVVACANPELSPGRMAAMERALATIGITGERIAIEHVPMAEMRTAPAGEPSAAIRERLWGAPS